MKKFKYWILILLLIPCFVLSACSIIPSKVYVTSISKGETIGNTTTYTVNYSDGSKSYFNVKDGQDGQDLTLEVIQQYCESQNITIEEYFESLEVDIPNIKTATNKALQSTVNIYAISPYAYNASYKAPSAGAGVIYKMEETYSYIITNYHVVESSTTSTGIAEKIQIMQYGVDCSLLGVEPYISPSINSKYYSDYVFSEKSITAEFIGGAATYDIAVLKVETEKLLLTNPYASAVTVAKDYSVAESIVAIGNPNGAGTSVTEGIVSVESEDLVFSQTESYRVMRIDAAVNGGNSGGGLFNLSGEFIGVVNAKMQDVDIDNIAYALPYDNVIKVADNLIHYYKQTGTEASVKKLYLNIEYSTSNSHAVYDSVKDTVKIYDTLVIKNVISGGVGHSMGFVAEDIVTKVLINETPYEIRRSYEFADLLLTIREGDSVYVYGTRNGETNVKLAKLESVSASQLTTID